MLVLFPAEVGWLGEGGGDVHDWREGRADEAHRIGLVNHVYERGELLDQAKAIAGVMVSKSKMGLRLTKDALNASLNICSFEDANKIEDGNQAFLIVSGMLEGSV